jgi:hypothetical protein
MRFPVDADLAVFVYTVGKVVFGSLPQLRRSVPNVPVNCEIEEVSASALSERQAAIFAPYDEKLAAMSYWPVCTYRVSNYGHNLMRTYVNPAETSRCVVMIVELNLNVAGKRPVSTTCMMSFHTRFADDTILTTRNMKLKSVLDRPPYQTVQERPYIKEPAEMKRAHDARAAKMGCPAAPPSNATRVFKAVHEEHDRFCEYQLGQGTFRLNPDRASYALADKAYWRGIRNHLNPFVHRFYALRFLPAALAAVFLPLLAVLRLAPAAAEAARNIGFPPDLAAEAMTLASYTVAGAVIGFSLENATFIWVFLLTYIPVRLVDPAALGPMPYSAFAGLVAYSIAQAKERRRAVLLPQRAR